MKKTLLLLVLLAYFNNLQAQLTPPAELQSYYSDVDFSLTGTQLFNDLATETIAKHTNILSYTARHNFLYNADADLSNSANVVLMYNGESRDKREYLSGSNSHSPQTFNTEHVYPQSLIVSNAVGDLHHLRSCDVSINSSRGNNPFATGSGAYKDNGSSFYPGDEWKGDVARMIMYLNLRYNESFNDVGSLNLFLQWNEEDPVSDFEKQRNEVIAAAQGNRNPFIDNPFIATVIWGGTSAENTWGEQDVEAPTIPANISLSTITASTINVSWSASSDNVGVNKYEVYANGVLNGETPALNYTASGLTPSTIYSITILAKDASNNKSAQSNAVSGTTLADLEAPSVPTNVTISNQSGTSFRVNWTASTDNSGVIGYDVFVDGILNGTTTSNSYDVTNLTISTTYSITVLAKDASNNSSAQSTSVNGATTDGTSDVSELFFSEYIEGSGYNKALEIVNLTSNNIDLSHYTIKRQSGGTWESPLQLVGTILVNDVYVIINSQSTNQDILREQDLAVANVTPMTFNGDDRIGLFKNDVLIDIIGDLDGTDEFALDVTLRRNSDTKGPTTDYNEQRDWSYYAVNTTNDIGNFNGTLSVSNNNFLGTFKMYPNPTNGNFVNIETVSDTEVIIYNALGKVVQTTRITSNKNNIDISNLSKGIYFVKLAIDKKLITQKLIRN